MVQNKEVYGGRGYNSYCGCYGDWPNRWGVVEMIRYIMSILDRFFHDIYVDKVMEEVMKEHMENPVIMVTEKGEAYWVGYNKWVAFMLFWYRRQY
jgi:hypothetical protein